MLHGRAWLATRMLSRQGCDLPALRRRDELAKVAVTGYWNRLLAAGALVSAAATLSDRLHLQLWGSLTVLLTALAVLAPTFQGWLKQAQALIDKREQKEEDRAKELADRARRDVLEQVRRVWVQTELRGSLYE